jgi:predicted RND superfamily exporter protein
MKKALIKLSIQFPKLVLAVAVIITVMLGVAIPIMGLKIDTDPENMLPETVPARIDTHEMKEDFGLYDFIVVGVVNEKGVFDPATLQRVADLTEGILNIEGVVADDVMAPTEVDDITTTPEGVMRVQRLIEEVPETDAGARAVLEQIKGNPMLRGKLASDDGNAIAIFVPLESKDVAARVAGEIEELIDHSGSEEYHIAGIPIAEDTFGGEMFKQMAVAAPGAFIVIFLLMLYFFRNAKVVIAPMVLSLLTVSATMGLLVVTGNTVHIMSSMTPVFLIPIAVLNSIHLLSELAIRYNKLGNTARAIEATIDELFVPISYTTLTTVVGFLSLLTTPIPPVQVFGLFVGIGVAIAWLLSFTFLPAYAMLLSPETLRQFGQTAAESEKGGGVTGRFLHLLRRIATRNGKLLTALGVVAMAISIYGLTLVQVNDNPVRWFKKSHPVRIADVVLNEHLAGTYMMHMVMTGDEDGIFTNPDVIQYVNDLQRELERHSNVGATSSVADVVRKVRFQLKGERPEEAILPESREEAAQYLFLYEMSGGDPEDLYKFISPEYDKANIWVQMHAGENQQVSEVLAQADRWIQAHPAPEGITLHWAGLPYINVVWQEKMVAGMGKALAGSVIVVLLMMIGLFRSLKLGLISMIPLSAAIAMTYAFLGFSGRPYDMPVAVLSSLSLGLAVDFAIHYLQRGREIYREENGNFEATMFRFYEGPAHALVRNIVVIAIGFVPMFFSSLIPYITVGAFFFAIMVVAGMTTLFALPAVLSLSPRAFFGNVHDS